MADTVYQTVNGPKTLAQMASELAAAGWPGPAGGVPAGAGAIANAYQQTTGGPVTESTSGQPSTDGGLTQAQEAWQAAQLADQQQQRALAATTAANKQTFDQNVSEFNQTHALALQQFGLSQQGQQFQQGISAAQLTGQYNGQPTLAAQQLMAQLTGQYNGQPTEAAREFNINTQSDLAKTAAGLSGPADYFKYLTALNGGRSIINNLTNGQAMPAGGAPVGATQPQSLNNILQQLGLGGTPVTPSGAPATPPVGTTNAPNGASSSSTGTSAPNTDMSRFMSGSVAPNATSSAIPNGQTGQSSNGQLMPGTTSEFSGAQQAFNNAAGQGGVQTAGQRGTNITGYDPTTGQLTFNYNFLTNKPRAVFGLYDNTTGQFVADPSNAQQGATSAGPVQAGNWMSYPYYSGSNGTGTFSGLTGANAIDPTHSYAIRIALPMEGGGTGSSMEMPVSGQQIMALQRQQAAPQSSSTPAASAMTAGTASTQQPNTNTGSGVALPYGMGQLPYMNQIQPTAYNSLSPSGQQFIQGAYAAAGYDPADLQRSILSGTPATGQAPSSGSSSYANTSSQSLFG